MKPLLKRKLTLTKEHKRTIGTLQDTYILEDTYLDDMITQLWHKFRPAKVYINNQDVSHMWDLWSQLDLEIGQIIIIEVRR